MAYTPLVPDSGSHIATKNKYRIVEWIVTYASGGSLKFAEVDPDWMNAKIAKFSMCQPSVFSSEGVPVSITENLSQYEKLDSWGEFTIFFPFILSVTTLPAIGGYESVKPIEFKVNSSAQTETMKVHCKSVSALTGYSPIALMIPMDDGYEIKEGYRTFHAHGCSVFGNRVQNVEDQALAYGLAVRLKEMEDAGLIDSAPGRANVRPSVPLSSDPVIFTPVSTHRPKPSVSEKPVVRRDRNVEVPVQNKTSNQSYEVENLTLQ